MTDRPAFAFTLSLALASLACLASTLSLSPVARMIPVIILLPTCALLLYQVYADAASTVQPGVEDGVVEDRRSGLAVLWSLAPALSIFAFGFIPGIVVFLVLFLAIHARERWPVVGVAATVAWLALEGLARLAPALDAGRGVLWPL